MGVVPAGVPGSVDGPHRHTIAGSLVDGRRRVALVVHVPSRDQQEAGVGCLDHGRFQRCRRRRFGEVVGDAVLHLLGLFLHPPTPAVHVGEPTLVGGLPCGRAFGHHRSDALIGGGRADGLLATHREPDDPESIRIDVDAR